MTLDVNEIKILQTNGVGAVSGTENTGAENVDFSKASGSEDTVVVENSTDAGSQASNVRSEQELYNKFINLSKKYTLSQNDIKNILETVSGYSEETLLNIEEAEINQIISIIDKAIEVLNYKKAEINAENIIDEAKGVKIRVDNGWTLDQILSDIKNVKQESLADKLRRTWPKIFGANYDFTDPNNKEQIKQKVEDYIRLYHKTENLANRDWAKMLDNSKNDAERDIFDSILTEINPEYRAKFIKSWLYSYDSQENRINAANRTDLLAITGDTNPEETSAIAHIIRANQNEEGITESDKVIYDTINKYFEENNIRAILDKHNNGVELTEEEQAIYDKWQNYQALMTGGITGTVANNVISDLFKEAHLHDFVNPQIYNYGEDVYRDVIAKVQEYYENHQNEFSMDPCAFEELMDKVTDGNYSTVTNGDASPLKAPVVNNNDNNNGDGVNVKEETPSFGNGLFSNKPLSEVESSIQKKSLLEENMRSFDTENVTNPIKSNAKKRSDYQSIEKFLMVATMDDINEFFAEDPVAAIKEVFNSTIFTHYSYEKALNTFANLNPSIQMTTVDGIHKQDSVKDAYKMMRAAFLDKITGRTYATEKARQEILEKKEELLGKTACENK